MTNRTPKRLAADILRADFDILLGYWQERLEGCGIQFTEAEAEEIQRHMDAISAPFLDRLDTIARDVNVHRRADLTA